MDFYFRNDPLATDYNDPQGWSSFDGGPPNIGSAPSTTDDVFFTANSGDCTINVSSGCRNLNCIGYTGTLTFDDSLNLKGDITLGTAMTVVQGLPPGRLFCDGLTGNFTSNGVIFDTNLVFNGLNFTYTFMDDWTVKTISNGNPPILNGSTIYVTDTVALSSFGSGTTVIEYTGTGGTIGGTLWVPLVINSSGTVTVNTLMCTGDASITYVAGTVTFAGTLESNSINTPLSNCSSLTFLNLLCTNGRFSVDSDITVSGDVTLTGYNSTIDGAGNGVYIGGSLTTNSDPSAPDYGTANIILNGTGTWSGSGSLRNNLIINTTGTITISGAVGFGSSNNSYNTLTYTAGTVVTTSSTLNINGNSTLNVASINWNNVSFNSGSSTTTLSANLKVLGTCTFAGATTLNGFTVNCASLAVNATNLGTTAFVMDGTGTWSGSSTLNRNLTINTAGTVTVSGSVAILGGVVRTAGTVVTTGSTISVHGSGTWDTSSFFWNNFSLVGGSMTTTLNSDLKVSGTFSNTVVSTINGFVIQAGSISIGNTLNGSSDMLLYTTGTWSGSGQLNMDLTINSSGTVTVSGTVGYGTGTLTYTAGTVVTTGSTLFTNGNCTLNTNGISWNNYTHGTVNGITATLTSNLTMNGTTTLGSGNVTFNGSTIIANGGIVVTGAGTISGTSILRAAGTGTLTCAASAILALPFVINTSGTLTISGNINYSGTSFTHTAGTVVATGSTLNFANASITIDASPITFANVILQGNSTMTLVSNMTMTGNLQLGAGNMTINGSIITTGGSLTISGASGTIAGTTDLVMNGTGTFSSTLTTGFLSLDLTFNTTGTITITGTIRYGSATSPTITYVAGTINATGSTLTTIGTDATFNTNGMTWGNFEPTTSLITLSSDLAIGGYWSNGNICTLNGAGMTAYVAGNLSVSNTISGTANIHLVGTGTWSGAGSVSVTNMTINTTGTITYTGTAGWGGSGTFTHTSGTVITTGSNFNHTNSGTFNCAGITWNDFSTQNSSSPITLLANLNVGGNLSVGTGGNTAVFNGAFNVNVGGNFSAGLGGVTGTSTIRLVGTGSWTAGGTNGKVGTNLVINTAGTITISGNVYHHTGIITYTAGTVITTGSSLTVTGPNGFNTNTMDWNNITFNLTTGIHTLYSDLHVLGTTTITGGTGHSLDGFTLYTASLTMTAVLSNGSTNIVFNGTGTWSGNANVPNNVEINTAGTLTISGSVVWGAGISGIGNKKTFKYTSGTVTTTGSSLLIPPNGHSDLDLNGISLNNLSTSSNATITLLSDLDVNGNYQYSGPTTMNGNNMRIAGNFTLNSNNHLGSTTIIMDGTGTWSGAGALFNNLTFNTAGIITISGSVRFVNGIMTYVAGTIITTGSNVTIEGTTPVFNTNGDITPGATTTSSTGVNWHHVTLSAARPLLLTSNMRVVGDCLIVDSLDSINKTTNEKCHIGGSLTTNYSPATINLTGTAELVLDGTGNYGSTAGQPLFTSQPVTINTTGTISLVGHIVAAGSSFKKVAGTVNAGVSRVTFSSTGNIDFAGVTFYNVNLERSSTHTLLADFAVDNDLTLGSTGNADVVMNGFTITAHKNVLMNISTGNGSTGTTSIVMDGTGTWTNVNGGHVGNNLEINTSGTITPASTVHYRTGILKYTAGTVVVTGNTLNISGSATIDTIGMSWNNISMINPLTLTVSSILTITGNFTKAGSSVVINGSQVNIGGNLTGSGNGWGGTSVMNFNGTGTWSGTASQTFSSPITFNTSGTITLSGTVTYNGTNTITYIAGTVVTTGTTFNLTGGATLDTAGITWNHFNFALPGANATLTSDMDVNGALTIGVGSSLLAINGVGRTIYAGGNVTVVTSTLSGVGGTASIVMDGTGTLSQTNGNVFVMMNLEINTTGTVTLSGTFRYQTGTFKITSGTFVNTGSTLEITNSASLGTGSAALNHLTLAATVTTLTLINDVTATGTFTSNQSSGITTMNGFTLYCGGNFTINVTQGRLEGTTNIVLNGTGTWSMPNMVTFHTTPGAVRNNLTINTSGTITISGYVKYDNGTLTYTSGTVITTGSTLVVIGAATTFVGIHNVTWANAMFSFAGTYTFPGDMTFTGNLHLSQSSNSMILNGTKAYVGGNLAPFSAMSTGGVSGTCEIIMNGTGSVSGFSNAGNSHFRSNLTINTTGTVTFTGQLNFDQATLKYLAGTVVTTGSTIYTVGSTTFDTNGVVWNNLRLVGGAGAFITLASNMTVAFLESNNSSVDTNTLIVNGNWEVWGVTGIRGTGTVRMAGTGTISNHAGGTIGINTVFNTSGTITIGTGFKFGGPNPTLTYTAGTMVTTNGITIPLSATLNTSGMTWATATVQTNGITVTLTSDWNVSGNVSVNTATQITMNGAILNIGGSFALSMSHINDGLQGTTHIKLIGTGTWTSPNARVSNNLTIDTAGTITVSGLVSFAGGILTHLNGTVITTGSILHTNGGGTYNTPNVLWGDVSWQQSTITLADHFYCKDITISNFQTFAGGKNIYCRGGLINGLVFAMVGSATLHMVGTGPLAGLLHTQIPVVINTDGVLTLSGTLELGGYDTHTYKKGRIEITSTGKLKIPNFAGPRFIGLHKVYWPIVEFGLGAVVRMDDFFRGTTNKPTIIRPGAVGDSLLIAMDKNSTTAHVTMKDCTVTPAGRLIVTTINANKGGNTGIIFGNALTNGISHGDQVDQNSDGYGWGGGLQGWAK